MLIQSRADRLVSAVSLYEALGGGWTTAPSTDPAAVCSPAADGMTSTARIRSQAIVFESPSADGRRDIISVPG
jgi:hypothetical protein